jgi:hypothetical protein
MFPAHSSLCAAGLRIAATDCFPGGPRAETMLRQAELWPPSLAVGNSLSAVALFRLWGTAMALALASPVPVRTEKDYTLSAMWKPNQPGPNPNYPTPEPARPPPQLQPSRPPDPRPARGRRRSGHHRQRPVHQRERSPAPSRCLSTAKSKAASTFPATASPWAATARWRPTSPPAKSSCWARCAATSRHRPRGHPRRGLAERRRGRGPHQHRGWRILQGRHRHPQARCQAGKLGDAGDGFSGPAITACRTGPA